MLCSKHFPVSNALGKMHINLIYSEMVMCYIGGHMFKNVPGTLIDCAFSHKSNTKVEKWL